MTNTEILPSEDYYLFYDMIAVSVCMLSLTLYHVYIFILQRLKPFATVNGLNNYIRTRWVNYIMKNMTANGTAIFAVQALRNTIFGARCVNKLNEKFC